MSIEDIQAMPTVIENNHESLYRAYHVLDKVRGLLNLNTPAEVIIEIIHECYRFPKERTILTATEA